MIKLFLGMFQKRMASLFLLFRFSDLRKVALRIQILLKTHSQDEAETYRVLADSMVLLTENLVKQGWAWDGTASLNDFCPSSKSPRNLCPM